MNNVKENFCRILKENNCLEEYLENFDEEFVKKTFKIRDHDIINLIILSFRWNETKQGFPYWCNVDGNWFEYAKNNIPREFMINLKEFLEIREYLIENKAK